MPKIGQTVQIANNPKYAAAPANPLLQILVDEDNNIILVMAHEITPEQEKAIHDMTWPRFKDTHTSLQFRYRTGLAQ